MSFQQSKTKSSDCSRGPRSSRSGEDPTRPLQKTLYELLEVKDYTSIDKLFEENRELFYTSTQKGLVSLILRYAIIKNNEELIESLIPRLTMKRDYFNLIIHNHPDKIALNIELFTKINVEMLESNDMKLIVESRLYYLLPLLEGKFIKVNIPKTIDSSPELTFCELINIETYIQKVVNDLCKKQADVAKFIKCIDSKKYDIVIDAGNVLHSRNGIPQPQDLIQMVRDIISLGLKPLVVIYPAHTKTYPELSSIADLCPSPYGDSDDYYILLAYLLNIKRGNRTHIVTNDEYQDHVLRLNDGLNVNSDFSGHMRDDQIRYTNIYGSFTITTPLKIHSNCIQIINSIVYIPTDDGGFIRIQL
jgi:hypothetical protein